AERKNVLSMFFYTCALWCWLQYEDREKPRWYGLSLASFTLALLSKTAPAPLPIVLLGIAWWRRGKIERRDFKRTIPFFAIAATLALVTIWFQAHKAIGHEIIRTDGFLARLAGAARAVWFYLYKALWPTKLMFVNPRWSIDPGSVWTYVPLAA